MFNLAIFSFSFTSLLSCHVTWYDMIQTTAILRKLACASHGKNRALPLDQPVLSVQKITLWKRSCFCPDHFLKFTNKFQYVPIVCFCAELGHRGLCSRFYMFLRSIQQAGLDGPTVDVNGLTLINELLSPNWNKSSPWLKTAKFKNFGHRWPTEKRNTHTKLICTSMYQHVPISTNDTRVPLESTPQLPCISCRKFKPCT